MKIDSNILIKQYYEEVSHKYPELSFEEFKEICKRPFEFTKEQMQSGELPVIRLKYFGTFLVYPKRASFLLKRIMERKRYNKIGIKEFNQKKEMLEKFLEQHES